MKSEFASIRLDNITAKYHDSVIFEKLDLTLPAKGCVCFVGPSGCGKTTLLQIIAGLKEPSEGRVYYERKTYEGKTPENTNDFHKTAYVFQEDRLIPWLTALENVSLVIEKENDHVTKAEYQLRKVGLQKASDKYPSQLSGGMKQRVSIARALAFDAPVILLDEPFKGLDDNIKNQIIGILNELKKDRLLILVTHDKEDVRLLADHIYPITAFH